MIKQLRVKTNSRTELLDITQGVQRIVAESGIRSGVCYLYVPHTTSGITINENSDPNVGRDILKELNKVIPFDDNYGHNEGNSAAHIKSSIIGVSKAVMVEEGRLHARHVAGLVLLRVRRPPGPEGDGEGDEGLKTGIRSQESGVR